MTLSVTAPAEATGSGVPEGPATGHSWTEFQEDVPEFEANFLDLLKPLNPGELKGGTE